MSTLRVIAIIVIIFILILIRNRQVVKSEERQKRKASWGVMNTQGIPAEKRKHIAGFHRMFLRSHPGAAVIDEITHSDLDLDGLFTAIDTCESSVGEEYLFHVLHAPLYDIEKIKARRDRIDHFISNVDTAVKDRGILSDLGKCKGCSFSETIHSLQNAKHISASACILQFVLLIAAVVLAALGSAYGLIAVFVVAIANIISYFGKKSSVGDHMRAVHYLMCLKRVANRLAKAHSEDDAISDIRDEINSALNSMSGLGALGFMITSGGTRGSFVDGLLDYIRMFTHLDLLAFELLRKRISEHEDDIYKLLVSVGEWETDIAFASFASSMDVICKADINVCTPAEKPYLAIKDAVHPLVDDAVSNSISTDGGVLITGSNASGKSTFLRTTALCVLLAQCSGYAPCSSYEGSVMRIYSSMSIKDSLKKNDSYYMAEIKSLKRIVDAAHDEEYPVICFIDEVLRGTNTIERIAASTELLRSLQNGRILTFAATHDLELTELLSDSFANYHFSEIIADGDVIFTYILTEGPAKTRNAIKLLSMVGYDSDIVEGAQKMAERYEQNGEWN